jgi:hypothetical protein
MAAERGWGLTALYALHRALQAASAGRARLVPYALVAQPIGCGVYAALRNDPATVVRVASPGDALSAAFPRPAAVNQQRWARGATCHVVTVKDSFAGTLWTVRGRYDEDEVRCEFVLADAQRCVWDFDVYVEPRFRLGRTLGRLWKAVDAQLAAEGVQWSFSRISLFNPASLSSHARLGARTTGHAVFLVLGPVQLAWSSLAPHWHLSTAAASRPQLRLAAPE